MVNQKEIDDLVKNFIDIDTEIRELEIKRKNARSKIVHRVFTQLGCDAQFAEEFVNSQITASRFIRRANNKQFSSKTNED